jgi:hypothetical protein
VKEAEGDGNAGEGASPHPFRELEGTRLPWVAELC